MVQWMAIAEGVQKGWSIFKKLSGWFSGSEELSDTELRQKLDQIIDSLEEVKALIVRELPETIYEIRLADLEGDVDGLLTNFREYRPYDKETRSHQWQLEAQRLTNIVDNSGGVEADLRRALRHLNLDNDVEFTQALQVFALYAILVPCRAAAMRERSRTYEMDDEQNIPYMLETARELAGDFYSELRVKSDRRFSHDICEKLFDGEPPVVRPHNGELPVRPQSYLILVGYTFEGRFYSAGGPVDRRRPEALETARNDARVALKRRRETELDEFPGVSVARAVLRGTG